MKEGSSQLRSTATKVDLEDGTEINARLVIGPVDIFMICINIGKYWQEKKLPINRIYQWGLMLFYGYFNSYDIDTINLFI